MKLFIMFMLSTNLKLFLSVFIVFVNRAQMGRDGKISGRREYNVRGKKVQ